jgi:hypothetical protein
VQVSENVEFSANLRFPKPIVSFADERYHSHIENILNFFGTVYLAILHNEKINPKFIVNVKKNNNEKVQMLPSCPRGGVRWGTGWGKMG